MNEANLALAEARAALKGAKASATGNPGNTGAAGSPSPSSSPTVPTASVERVQTAEADLEAASQGITVSDTSTSQATEVFTSAAFALEVTWLNLFADAGCLTDEQSTDAHAAIRQYTTALQTDLEAAGLLQGAVDGVHGPETVQAVEGPQADADLPVTGLVDRATRAALGDALEQTGQSAAANELVEATSVQTVLKLPGYWPGAIDGQWTPELEEALREFQTDLGVEPTGTVDAATLAAIEEALVATGRKQQPPRAPLRRVPRLSELRVRLGFDEPSAGTSWRPALISATRLVDLHRPGSSRPAHFGAENPSRFFIPAPTDGAEPTSVRSPATDGPPGPRHTTPCWRFLSPLGEVPTGDGLHLRRRSQVDRCLCASLECAHERFPERGDDLGDSRRLLGTERGASHTWVNAGQRALVVTQP